MDKFGIFKLLNSFLDFYSENKQGGKTDVFDSLSSVFGKNSSSFKAENVSSLKDVKVSAPVAKTEIGKPALKPPLQNSILSVMRSHDIAVNRVRGKNGG